MVNIGKSIQYDDGLHKGSSLFRPLPQAEDPYQDGEPPDIALSEIDYKGKTYEVTTALSENLLVFPNPQYTTRPLVVIQDGEIILAFAGIGVASRHFKVEHRTIHKACDDRKKLLGKFYCKWIDKSVFNELLIQSEKR
jgi:hypothetical protein